jgi:hypothetical protein
MMKEFSVEEHDALRCTITLEFSSPVSLQLSWDMMVPPTDGGDELKKFSLTLDICVSDRKRTFYT